METPPCVRLPAIVICYGENVQTAPHCLTEIGMILTLEIILKL